MREPLLQRRTYAVQPTAKVTYCLEGISCLRSTHLRGQLNKVVTCWKNMYIEQDRINSNHSLQDPHYIDYVALAAPL